MTLSLKLDKYQILGDSAAFSRSGSEGYDPSFGLTKREYFAAMAMLEVA